MTALEHMRRRSRAMAWAMTPLLVVMWLVTSAACPGMAPGDALLGTNQALETAHEQGVHDPSDHDDGSGHHSHAGTDVDHAAIHDHQSCPHCVTSPAGDGIDSDHVACGVSESTVAAPGHSAAHSDLKPFLSPIALIAPAAAALPIRTSGPLAYPASAPEPRPLNVRYCVFLL